MDSPTPQPLGQFIVDSPPAAPPQQFYAAQAQYYEAPGAAKAYQVVPTPPKGNGNSGVLIALLIVLLVVAILYMCLKAQQYQGGRSLGNALASCGWVLYTLPGCTYCTKQMDALGEATYPKQVVCGRSTASGTMSDSQGPYLCKNVQAFPFWVNEYTSATRTGLQDRKQLRQMLRSPGS
jgi:hypothetical protein